MADAPGKTQEYATHPYFSRENKEVADAVTFMGYMGPAAADGSAVLYATLDELADCIEIPPADLLHVEDVPETVMPFGAKRVWIASKAKITRRRSGAAEDMTPARGPKKLVEVRKGRLQMMARKRPSRDEDCGNCISMCTLCISPCNCGGSSECKVQSE